MRPAGPGPRWLADTSQYALAGGLALFLLPASVNAARSGGVGPAWSTALVVALVGLHIGVAMARRRPVLSFSIGALACLTLVVAPDLAGETAVVIASDYSPILSPSTLCFFPLVYAVSAHADPPWPNVALGIGLVGSCLTVARLWGFTGVPVTAWAWWLMLATTAVGGTVAAWALGRYRVTRSAWTTQLEQRVAADERRRIAREMHDVVAHSLAVVVSQAEAGRLVVPNAPERATEILGTIADAGREALTEMRALLGVLRDDELPTEPAPGLADLPALVERMRTAGLDVRLRGAHEIRVPPAVGLTVYRVVQESLTNVARHAGGRPAAEVTVHVSNDRLDVEIADDGTVSTVGAPPGRGLVGMRERVEAVAGTFEAGPAAHGWRVHARIPL